MTGKYISAFQSGGCGVRLLDYSKLAELQFLGSPTLQTTIFHLTSLVPTGDQMSSDIELQYRSQWFFHCALGQTQKIHLDRSPANFVLARLFVELYLARVAMYHELASVRLID